MNGAERIAAERQRQIMAERWVPEHDDDHTQDELPLAAAAYAIPEDCRDYEGAAPFPWPWLADDFKPTPENRIRELEKAGALIAAEIDRLLRLQEAGRVSARCRSCDAEIVWAVTTSGKRMPLDAEPVALAGHFVFDNGYAKQPPPLRVSHFATCPNADEHRGPR